MNRKEELIKCFTDAEALPIVTPLIDDVVFIESQLAELKKLPFIRVNPNNPADQKATPAAKQYKELLQQYNNCIKILAGLIRKEDGYGESPLREYLKRLEK